jgi:hypothetical protein
MKQGAQVTYGVALKIKEEQCARRQRNYERRARVRQRTDMREQRENERSNILDELVATATEADKLRIWLHQAKRWPARSSADEFTRFVEWARERLKRLEDSVHADGIAESLRERELFPEADMLIDPPDDLIEE